MDPREGRELPSSDELEEETIARKRSRRVSFAETTAVHVFDRDEDYETPPDAKPDFADGSKETVGFQGDLSDSDDSKGLTREEEEEDDDEDDGEQERFVRDMDSSSPGTAGSVTSNDDDNFFGPVSTSFIRSGRLSEVGLTDDKNHDITLDSTAFSLHFRNIAAADDQSANSVGSIRTPTGDSIPSDTANIGILTRSNKSFFGNKHITGNASVSGGDSGNMSLIVDNPSRYDYGKLSPTLEKLLDEVNKSMQPSTLNNSRPVVTSDSLLTKVAEDKDSGKHKVQIVKTGAVDDATSDYCLDSYMPKSFQSDNAIKHLDNSKHSPTKQISTTGDKLGDDKTQDNVSSILNECHGDARETIPSEILASTIQNVDTISPSYERSRNKFFQPDHVHQTLFHDHMSGSKFYTNASTQASTVTSEVVMTGNQVHAPELQQGMYTPKSALRSSQATLQDSVSSLRAKRQQIFLNPADISSSRLPNFSAREQPPSSLEAELKRHGERISAIKYHISKFKIPETPEFKNSRLGTTGNDHVTLDHGGVLEKTTDVPNALLLDVPVFNMENNLVNVDHKNRTGGLIAESEHSGFVGTDGREVIQSEEVAGESVKLIETESSFHCTKSEVNMACNSLTSNNPTEVSFTPSIYGSSPSVKFLKESSEFLNTSSQVNHQVISSFQDSIPVQEDLVRKKRTKQNSITDEDHASKISKTDNATNLSSDIMVGTSMLSPVNHLECTDEYHDIGNKSPSKGWPDILAKILEAARLVFSPSILELSLQEINAFEDMLGELHMSRKYIRLSSSLKNNDHFNNLHQQRLAEARFLQDKLLCEQAKKQIKHVKLEKLLNKAQLTQSGLQECQNLKLIFQQLCVQSTNATKNQLHQEESNMVTSMRKELKLMEQNMNDLIKSLEVSCKIKGKMNCDEIIKVASKHLEMKSSFRIIQQELRLWELCNIVRRNDQREIVLSYCDLIFQRFTMITGQVSNLIVSNSLNDEIIQKIFPRMNSCPAFEFVFNVNCDVRLANLKCFHQKILETSLLLGVLVDVLEEVKVASMEMMNLTCSSFYPQPSGQLELHISFMNFKSSQKVTLVIDLSELSCAVYPSEPSELRYRICGARATLPPLISDSTGAAIKSLQGGRWAILRLCRSISEAVQAW